MKKVRLSDIALEAQVGLATVERVLNGRGKVAPATAEKVISVARRLGYDRSLPEQHRGVIRIEVIMMRPDAPFYARLNEAFARIAAVLDSSITVHRTFLDEDDPIAVARHIADPGFRRSGLIIVAPDHPEVRARIREAKAAGVAIVHIVSRIPDTEDPFVGVDNYAAGRTAAYYLSHVVKPRSGCLLALCHSGIYQAHRDRIQGFSDYLAAHPDPALRFALVMFGHDDPARSTDLLEEALRFHPDTIGIYTAGGGNAGVATLLERRKGQITWIGHELTDDSRRWLKQGLMEVVLDQAPEVQARRALDLVLKRIGFIDIDVSTEPVRFLTVVAENL
jgi:LacI family transcriptional regulator